MRETQQEAAIPMLEQENMENARGNEINTHTNTHTQTHKHKHKHKHNTHTHKHEQNKGILALSGKLMTTQDWAEILKYVDFKLFAYKQVIVDIGEKHDCLFQVERGRIREERFDLFISIFCNKTKTKNKQNKEQNKHVFIMSFFFFFFLFLILQTIRKWNNTNQKILHCRKFIWSKWFSKNWSFSNKICS